VLLCLINLFLRICLHYIPAVSARSECFSFQITISATDLMEHVAGSYPLTKSAKTLLNSWTMKKVQLYLHPALLCVLTSNILDHALPFIHERGGQRNSYRIFDLVATSFYSGYYSLVRSSLHELENGNVTPPAIYAPFARLLQGFWHTSLVPNSKQSDPQSQ
jgi:hypothetical protein